MTEPAPQAQPEASPPPMFSETRKVAVHGDYCTQKTLQIAHLIDRLGASSIVVVSAEKGLGTIQSKITPEMVIPVTSFEEFRSALRVITEKHNSPDKWVCIDGATRLMKWKANELISETGRVHDALSRKQSIADADVPYKRYLSDKGNVDMMKIYGRIGIDSERVWSALVRLHCNLYVNFLADETKSDGYSRLPPIGPDVPGRLGLDAVMSSFDYVLALFYDAAGRLVARTRPSGLYMARTREDRAAGIVIPEEIVGFNLAEFVDLINGGRK